MAAGGCSLMTTSAKTITVHVAGLEDMVDCIRSTPSALESDEHARSTGQQARGTRAVRSKRAAMSM